MKSNLILYPVLTILVLSFFIDCLGQQDKEDWFVYSANAEFRTFKEHNGELWIATENGLVRFNKETGIYQTLNKGNSDLHSYRIDDMEFDGNRIIIGTYELGLAEVDMDTEVFNRIDIPIEGTPANGILSLEIDPEGVWWVATRETGLLRYANEEWEVLGLPENENNGGDKGIWYVLLDQQDRLWCLGRASVFMYQDGEWTDYSSSIPADAGVMNYAYQDFSGDLWFASKENFCYQFDGELWTSHGINMRTVCQSNDGQLWSVADSPQGKGLYEYQNGAWLKSDLEVPDQDYKFMSLDAEGEMWFLPRIGKMGRFDGDEYQEYELANTSLHELIDDPAYVITSDPSGRAFAFLNGTLAWQDQGQWNFQETEMDLPHKVVGLSVIDEQNYVVYMRHYDNPSYKYRSTMLHVKDGLVTAYDDQNSPLSLEADEELLYQVLGDTVGNFWVSKSGFPLLRLSNGDWAEVQAGFTGQCCRGLAQSGDQILIAECETLYAYSTVNGALETLVDLEEIPADEVPQIIEMDVVGESIFLLTDNSAASVIRYEDDHWDVYAGFAFPALNFAEHMEFVAGELFVSRGNSLRQFDLESFAVSEYSPANFPLSGEILDLFEADNKLWIRGEGMALEVVSIDQPSSLEVSAAASQFQCYPNPTSDRLQLWISSESTEQVLQIYNSKSQLIYSALVWTGNHEIDTSSWMPGLYWISLAGEARQVLKF